jgi:hypothetical protein
LAAQVLAAEASWELRVQPVLQPEPAETAEPDRHVAASVRQVFPAVAVVVVDSQVAVAPVADPQVP